MTIFQDYNGKFNQNQTLKKRIVVREHEELISHMNWHSES